MKSKILALTLGLLVAVAANAQAHCGACGVGDAVKETKGSMKGAAMGDAGKMLQDKLGITAEEAAKLKEAKKVMMDKIAAAKQEYHDTVSKILSPDKMDKFMHMKGNMPEGHGSMKGSH